MEDQQAADNLTKLLGQVQKALDNVRLPCPPFAPSPIGSRIWSRVSPSALSTCCA